MLTRSESGTWAPRIAAFLEGVLCPPKKEVLAPDVEG